MQYTRIELTERVREAATGGRPLTADHLEQVEVMLMDPSLYDGLEDPIQDLVKHIADYDGKGNKYEPKTQDLEKDLDKIWEDLGRASSSLAGLIEDDSWTIGEARSLHDRMEKLIGKFQNTIQAVTAYGYNVELIVEQAQNTSASLLRMLRDAP